MILYVKNPGFVSVKSKKLQVQALENFSLESPLCDHR